MGMASGRRLPVYELVEGVQARRRTWKAMLVCDACARNCAVVLWGGGHGSRAEKRAAGACAVPPRGYRPPLLTDPCSMRRRLVLSKSSTDVLIVASRLGLPWVACLQADFGGDARGVSPYCRAGLGSGVLVGGHPGSALWSFSPLGKESSMAPSRLDGVSDGRNGARELEAAGPGVGCAS